MITILLNDTRLELAPDSTLQDVVSQQAQDAESCALAINNQFIPRSAYQSTILQDGDRIELLIPMQGG